MEFTKEELKFAIEQDVLNCKYISKELSKDGNFIGELLNMNPKVYGNVPRSTGYKGLRYATKETIIQLIQAGYDVDNILYRTSVKLLEDKDIALIAVEVDSRTLRWFRKELGQDKDVVMKSLEKDIRGYEHISDKIKSKIDIPEFIRNSVSNAFKPINIGLAKYKYQLEIGIKEEFKVIDANGKGDIIVDSTYVYIKNCDDQLVIPGESTKTMVINGTVSELQCDVLTQMD